MKNLYLTLIGLLSFITMMPSVSAATDCDPLVDGGNFRCPAQQLSSFCLSGHSSGFNIYGKSYCHLSESSDEETFKALEEQFKVEDSKYTADQLKYLLFGMQEQSLRDFLQAKYGNRNDTNKLPDSVKRAFFQTGSYDQQNQIRERIRLAFNQQKIIEQTQKSLKAQFESREIWANGNLNDSPFDLVVDLNLIEQILFGQKAKWLTQNDVWKWPPNESQKEELNDPENKKNPAVPGQKPSNKKPNLPKAEEYECQPPQKEDEKRPGNTPPLCGNGQKEDHEACDDGNLKSGDGCSNTCETEPGADLMCRDIEAVNFKTFNLQNQMNGQGQTVSDQNQTPPISCPKGTVPVKKINRTNQVPQPSNYGGPFVGGVLRNFPESNKPKCPVGSTWAEVSIAGRTFGQCFTDQFCFVDFNDARSFLYDRFKNNLPKEEGKPMPDKWQDVPEDHPANAVLGAIEARICVNIRKVNRPPSPYKPTDGCIDCHIQAMNDVMKKLLSKNVTPQQTPMQAFGMTNRWGPSLSFNFNVLTQGLKNAVFQPKYSGIETKKLADQAILGYQNNQPVKAGLQGSQSVDTLLSQAVDQQNKQKETYYQNLKQYHFTGDGNADREVQGPLNNLLLDLNQSFERIQSQYQQITTSVEFAKKNQCAR